MEAARHIVALEPTSVELIDSTMIALARDIDMYRPTLEAFVRGDPQALLVTEFAESREENERKIAALEDTMSDLGYGFGRGGTHEGGVVRVEEARLQAAIADLRAGGLNIMMSMKEEGKPVSFVEDCAVPLEHLADYTGRLTAIFEKHGTRGTWYAHASVGCLHVRPVLNMKLDKDARTMRAIAEEAFAMVREYKGSHSGEHGDGIVRSEFHEAMFGSRLARAFEEVKRLFDPASILNPGKIVNAPRMDDRTLFRYPPGYRAIDLETGFDWSAWPGRSGGLQGAIEMCNNNGACRKHRRRGHVSELPRDARRARRHARTGEHLASGAFRSARSRCVHIRRHDGDAEALRLLQGVPAGMPDRRRHGEDEDRSPLPEKQETRPHQAAAPDREPSRVTRHGLRASARFTALRNGLPPLRGLSENLFGLSRRRSLPRFASRPFRDCEAGVAGRRKRRRSSSLPTPSDAGSNRSTLRAAVEVLSAGGYAVEPARPTDGGRPLCCGRTYLAAGLVDEARAEASRTLEALLPRVREGAVVVGLEPSCMLTMRDEFLSLLPGDGAGLLSRSALLVEEFLVREHDRGRLDLDLRPVADEALLHGHCHQKSFGVMGTVERALGLVPGLAVKTIESSCCGMAGAFGYDPETIDISFAMGELSLLPAVRASAADAIIVADGTSCRHQIADGAGRHARACRGGSGPCIAW